MRWEVVVKKRWWWFPGCLWRAISVAWKWWCPSDWWCWSAWPFDRNCAQQIQCKRDNSWIETEPLYLRNRWTDGDHFSAQCWGLFFDLIYACMTQYVLPSVCHKFISYYYCNLYISGTDWPRLTKLFVHDRGMTSDLICASMARYVHPSVCHKLLCSC